MPSKKQYLVASASIFSLIVILFIAGYIIATRNPQFDELTINRGFESLDSYLDEYIVLDTITGDEESVQRMLGTIAIKEIRDGQAKWTFDGQFRPDLSKIVIKALDEFIYRGIVSAGAKVEGLSEVITGSIGADELAEMTVQNQLSISHKNNTDIPIRAMSMYRFQPGKEYYFLDQIIVTNISSRKFRKYTGDAKLSGMAFGANGEVYTSQEEIKSSRKIIARAFDISALQQSEGGYTDRSLTKLINDAIEERIDEKDQELLLEKLRGNSKGKLPPSAPFKNVTSALPAPLEGLDRLVWIDRIYPIRQSNRLSCWAAASAMLYSHKLQRHISEREAVVSIGTVWTAKYESRDALPAKQKLRFLSEAGFKFLAPQSFHAEGLMELLQKHGPLWFTVDLDETSHASILTGLFVNSVTKEYWVSYIDPMDGSSKADTFNSFMRRYEEPAWRDMRREPGPDMTYEDLFIQVVHL